MAEEDIPVSKLIFPGVIDLHLMPDYELECEYVGSCLISRTVSRYKEIIKPDVQTFVCDLKIDGKIDRKGVKSHKFGIANFNYFYGLGINYKSWFPSWSEDDRDKWESIVDEIRQLGPNSELPQSLISSCELVGSGCLDWVLHVHQKTCPLCNKQLTIGDEVATLVNLYTKKLACSTRANSGSYHVFHTPCLIRWILFCDYMLEYGGAQADPGGQMVIDSEWQLSSVTCPECRGTGTKDEEKGEFETETAHIGLSRMALLKGKASYAYTKWMEFADSALTEDDKVVGLTFRALPEDPAGELEILKALHVYQGCDEFSSYQGI